MYKIVKCPKCKKFQMSVSEKSFSCKHCSNKESILKMKIYFENSSPQIVSEILKKIKQEEFNIKENIKKLDEFKSAF